MNKEKLLKKFEDVSKNRVTETINYHSIFDSSYMMDMEMGEEIINDIWRIVRIPNGWIVNRHTYGQVFVPYPS